LLSEVKKLVFEVARAIIPIVAAVILLQFSVIFMPIATLTRFIIGSFMVMLGLLFFLLGVRIGLLPMGRAIGSALPTSVSMVLILVVALILGFSVTIAEPDVQVLAYQVDFVSGGTIDRSVLILMVALGVGIFVALSILRIVLGIPIAYLLGAGYMAVLILSFFTPQNYLPVAFDAGGVTTGPLTVPFILAFGLGIASVLRGKSSLSDGFGLIGLASIGPILSVMLLGVILG